MSKAPIPAATLISAREQDGSRPPELLMVERAQAMAFAGGALVFPGGRIDEADQQLAAAWGAEDGPARVAAIRETLEETAVPVGLEPLPSSETALLLQKKLAAGRSFAQLLAEHRLTLRPGILTPLARWVPSFHASRRFDTVFFIAAAPEGDWQPSPLQGECTGAFWLTAAEVLERDRSGEAQLIFPTRRTLERLAQHSTLAEMLADAKAHSVEPITPWLEEVGGEEFVTIPDGLGFPVTRERLEGLWRG
jgi:8-oxo-dGTP pyrophosphatase MutT (NUDIX family)